MAGVALLTAPAAASAPVSFESSVTPDRIVFPGTTELTYRLHMRSGATANGRDIAFSAFTRLPLYGAAANPGAGEGSPLLIEAIGFEGAATPSRSSELNVLPACSPHTDRVNHGTGPTFHGFEPRMWGYDITLPPNAEGAMVVRARTGPFAPWRSLDYLIRFEIAPVASTPLFRTETVDEQTVTAPRAPRLEGPTGVEIVLRSNPPTRVGAVARVNAGAPIAIRGRTSPRIPGQYVQLRYYRPDDPRGAKLRRLARVRVGEAGRFRYRWRPRTPGRYELWALYRSQRRDLVSDHACPLFYDVD